MHSALLLWAGTQQWDGSVDTQAKVFGLCVVCKHQPISKLNVDRLGKKRISWRETKGKEVWVLTGAD